MRLGRTLAIMVALLAAACSSSAGLEAVEPVTADSGGVDSTESGAVEAAVPPSAAFCTDANRFVTSSDARLVTTPDAQVFSAIDAMLEALVADAPSAVSADIDTLRDGFGGIGDAYAAVDFDPSATLQLPADLQQSNGVAVRNLENYLVEACDLDVVRSAQIDDIVEAFGMQDLALAECFHTQLGDVANIESSSLTPELMITEICGTSILGLLSGEGETSS